ncbi:MAG: 2Fe-2S iron-sulfur cluster-binding protein [Gemmataceae bacterium]
MLQPAQGILVDRERNVTFHYNGKLVESWPGQTVGAALYDAGIRVFSLSYREGRPRGLFCMSGDCGNCLMQVDGRPNVRVCVEPVRQGMQVKHQHAWPSLGFDVSWLLGYAFKSFRRPLQAPLIANPERFPTENLAVDVCVIGGGPAGLAAVDQVAGTGLQVMLIERLPRLGGHLLFDSKELGELEPYIESLRERPNVQIMTDTTVFELSALKQVSAWAGDRIVKIQATQVIVCTGGRERRFVFHNNDLPGVMLCRGVQRLGRLYGVSPGRSAVVVTDHDEGARMAEGLAAFGVEVAAVVDPRAANLGKHFGRGWASQTMASFSADGDASRGWRLLTQTIVLEAIGEKRVQGIKVAQRNADGSIAARSMKDIDCDLICIASRPFPANELAVQAGVRYLMKDGQWHMTRSVPGVYVAGAASGTPDVNSQVLEGRLRGAEAAALLGRPVAGLERFRKEWEKAATEPRSEPARELMPYVDKEAVNRYVCNCADVTQAEIELALVEGAESYDAVKQRTKVTQGACAGKMCDAACLEICARHGREPAAPPDRQPGALGTEKFSMPRVHEE